MQSKSLGYGTGTSPLQVCDYDYLPNGFLKSMNNVQNLGTDLFALQLNYAEDIVSGVTPQKNGNISEAIWKTPGDASANVYGYQYDFLQRLTDATSGSYQNGSYAVTDLFNTHYEYDQRGNIKVITRRGNYASGNGQNDLIDNLSFDYTPNTNRLLQVADAITGIEASSQNITVDQPITTDETITATGTITATSQVAGDRQVTFRAGSSITLQPGFSVTAASGGNFLATIDPNLTAANEQAGFVERSAVPYTYDANGNLTSDLDKDITSIEYNHLNLPNAIYLGSNKRTLFTYTAAGQKIRTHKQEKQGTEWITVDERHYYSGVELHDEVFEALYHSAGRITKTGSGNTVADYQFEYTITDHLGNTRLQFADVNGDATVDASEVLRQFHYYPFGMEMNGDLQNSGGGVDQRYRYNGKEFSEELGLYDYGARWY
ncbi:MAG: 3-coathanger stack domain-containing protein, partial [Bacteroidota bacterium]